MTMAKSLSPFSILIFVIVAWVTPAISQSTILNRQGWNITADSSSSGFNPPNAIDGSLTSYWESTGDLPHWIIIDMKKDRVINGISYLPRQEASGGIIGQHSIELSSDGTNWGDPVAVGSYYNDLKLKKTSFVNKLARYIRVTAKNNANGGQSTSVCDINVYGLPDPPLSRSAWTVSADSQEVSGANAKAQMAIDGNPNTIWHTQWVGQVKPFPHNFTIDQGSAVTISGLRYLPRPSSTGANGRIGNFSIEVSANGTSWSEVSSGRWEDSAEEKTAYFDEQAVRFVRLNAFTEAGKRGNWSSASEINLINGNSVAEYTAPTSVKGVWKNTVDFPLVPAAAAIIPQTGKVLLWSASKYDDYQKPFGQTISAIYNPTTGEVTGKTVTDNEHDMFCPGISMDVNGRFIITGGNNAAKTTIYNGADNKFSKAKNMNTQRGYQSSVTTSQGKIFTIGGSWSGERFNKSGEIYDPNSDIWTALTGAKAGPANTADREGVYRADNHMWLFGWKNGSVFQAGPSRAMNWYDTIITGGSQTGAGGRSTDTDSMNGNAIMYDAEEGKILTVGGAPHYQNSNAHNRAYVITLGAPNSNQTNVTEVGSMSASRAFHNSVVLPDGKVLVLGGQSYALPFSDNTASLDPEIFDPATGQFTKLNPHATPRTYHSISLLLPDGTVLLGGGGLCGNAGDCAANHFDGEIFEPPYLFDTNGSRATRPTIGNMAETSFNAGDSITINTSGSVKKFSLVRLGSVTHSVNTDQRRIALTPTSSGNSHSVTIPADKGVSNPGYYYLFALNGDGVPSEAKIIQIK